MAPRASTRTAAEPPGQVGRTRRMAGSTTLDLWDASSGHAVLDPVTLERHEMQLHGHRVSYRTAGSGPALLLLHGITNSSETWERAASLLAERFTVIAPDLMGHGKSATPRGDYSLGAHASGARDVVTALGHDRVTVVGHSLGGGIAMQFAYQFPERTERLVLVSSGGLGREVNLLLRAAALPGSEFALRFLAPRWLGRAAGGVGWAGSRIGFKPGRDVGEMFQGFLSLSDRETRAAFVQSLRAVVDTGGQRVNGHDRLYLAAGLPTLLVWGERDPVIPVGHAHGAHAAMPGSRLELFREAGHFPHMEEPERFAAVLEGFLAETEPGRLDAATLREQIREGAPLVA